METHTQTESNRPEFSPGSSVIYAMHGKCSIIGTEVRDLNGQSIAFYKLKVKKSALSRSSRQEPAIWVPMTTAREQGMRLPMNQAEAENAMALLLSREYFFKPNDTWTSLQTQLEASIRIEGGIGLAKVASFLFVLKRKQIVPSPEVVKLQETVHKLLFRELSEALGQPPRVLEEKILKGFKSKLIPDN